jgi:hypothetical protein
MDETFRGAPRPGDVFRRWIADERRQPAQRWRTGGPEARVDLEQVRVDLVEARAVGREQTARNRAVDLDERAAPGVVERAGGTPLVFGRLRVSQAVGTNASGSRRESEFGICR